MTASASVTIVLPRTDTAPPVRWAAAELQNALARRNVEARIADTAQSGIVINVFGAGLPDTRELPVELPEAPESFVLVRQGDIITAWGSDTRGLVFALTELADRVRFAPGQDLFEGTFPLVEQPSARVRSMSRLFCSEQEDKIWFYDRQQWREYLSMLAANRFNRFSLALGFGYNYPYHNPWITDVYFYFPYPYLLNLPAHDVRVEELPDDERELNLEMLKFIGREAAKRGLEFQLALWTQRYDFDDVPRANYTVTGITKDNLAPYCREAITTLLKEVPEITGLTFRVHVEGGIAEGEYGFWEEAFAGVAAAGRPIEIDMHGKGLDHRMIGIARASGMPIAASPKYLAEHMGPPYHQSAIRDKEYPPEVARSEREQLSEGSRKFLRYSYGDLLTADKDYKVIYRIWPGTQRVLLWGDPEFAAGYGRSSMFAGSDGVEWCEPLGFKGRMGTGIPGGRFNYQKQGLATRYDWQKYDYQYRVWGRLLYNPDAPRESWMRYLTKTCGDTAEACEKGLSWASRVLPLVTLAHGPSASNNHYWPEVYTNLALIDGSGRRAYGSDMEGPVRFGNAPTFDPALFANAREYIELLLNGKASHRYTPLDVADWLDEMAHGCESAVLKATGTKSFGNIAVQRMIVDIQICAGLARFFAERFRAACWAELFVATKVTTLMDRVIDHANRSLMAWEKIADISRDLYMDDLTYGPQSWLRGSWHSRLPEMRAELADLESLRGGGFYESVRAEPAVAATIAALEARQPVSSSASSVHGAPTFKPGEDFVVRFAGETDGEPLLHCRHVNQAERWISLPMRRREDSFVATIPGDYTRSKYHLQYFVSFERDGRNFLSPGLQPNLANEPYLTSLQERGWQ
ncbi:hypothetical protein ABK249_23760 [Neorhizobium sp. Rsf11]|uniref:Uncharacterized protein n=2 Tax=Neorhizobium TaxID=1525371 RepID=A0ABV0MA37_9HYPH|nr:hypothetical protein [Neorhizobium petrolearium]MCC2611862.1 hypothetical protein [Neorhizobium petrolearium]WGI67027.1 hypothetical protein QEO92_18710 [Neorhizobium petrolearium]